jgi:homoserine O-succinyltransferase
MPIAIPDHTPAAARYRAAGVALAPDGHAVRALRLLVVTLVPHPLETETLLLRLLAESPLQIDVTLVRSLVRDGADSASPGERLLDHHRDWQTLRTGHFDGLVVSAAAAGGADWDQFAAFLDWTRDRVGAALFLGWAAEAALGHFHGLLGQRLAEPVVAVVPHRVADGPLLACQDRAVAVPLARAARFPRPAFAGTGLDVLVDHAEHGAHLVHDAQAHRLYALDHLEASAGQFARALRRRHGAEAAETAAGIRPGQPWRSYAHLLVADWLDQEVHQGLAGRGLAGRAGGGLEAGIR